jgi:hypothetical protein
MEQFAIKYFFKIFNDCKICNKNVLSKMFFVFLFLIGNVVVNVTFYVLEIKRTRSVSNSAENITTVSSSPAALLLLLLLGRSPYLLDG